MGSMSIICTRLNLVERIRSSRYNFTYTLTSTVNLDIHILSHTVFHSYCKTFFFNDLLSQRFIFCQINLDNECGLDNVFMRLIIKTISFSVLTQFFYFNELKIKATMQVTPTVFFLFFIIFFTVYYIVGKYMISDLQVWFLVQRRFWPHILNNPGMPISDAVN